MRPIDADALLKQLVEVAQRANKNAAYTGNRISDLTWDMAVKYIKNAPTSEQKKGKWIKNEFYENALQCSNCQAYLDKEDWSRHYFYFCYHCGAFMEGMETEE